MRIGITARNSWGRTTPGGPLLHASTGYPRSRTGRTFRALCGAGVYHHEDHVGRRFDPKDPRACAPCAAEHTRRSNR